MERKLTTILAADVAGSDRFTETDEEGTLARPKILHQEQIDPNTAEYRYPAKIT